MAIAADKTRVMVTMTKQLRAIIEAQAKLNGLSLSEQLCDDLEKLYAEKLAPQQHKK